MNENHDFIKHILDIIAAAITVGAVMKLLTPLAALFTIFWTGLRIVEMFYGHGHIAAWFSKRRGKRKAKA